MSKVWFTADTHWGHKAITKYRPLATAEEHHEVILDNILSTVSKRDTLWVLGDICFSKEYVTYLQTIANNVNVLRLVPGNHCVDSKYYTALEGNVRVKAFTEYKNCWVSHCPIHYQEIRNRKINIYGHLHGNVVKDMYGEVDRRYYCVSLEHHDYKPVGFEQIKEDRAEFFRKQREE